MTSAGWGGGEADTQRTPLPASPLIQPVGSRFVLDTSGSGLPLEYPIYRNPW